MQAKPRGSEKVQTRGIRFIILLGFTFITIFLLKLLLIGQWNVYIYDMIVTSVSRFLNFRGSITASFLNLWRKTGR